MSNFQTTLDGITKKILSEEDWGAPASYIPELSDIDPQQFSISVCLADGQCVSSGAATHPFSIQSISKVFSLAAVLGRVGNQIWSRVGREPSGNSFDSVVLLEKEHGRPRNPFINSGAIVVTDELLAGREPHQALTEVVDLIRYAADDTCIYINKSVAHSEESTGARNKALAHYLQSHDNLRNAPEHTLGVYFHQCAIEMTTFQLAKAGRIFAGFPNTPRVLSPSYARRINALMMTCGQYDGSGEFAYQVGLPSKSGVGGGLLLIAPHKASIAIWSPGLDGYGNSKAGTRAAKYLSQAMDWSVF